MALLAQPEPAANGVRRSPIDLAEGGSRPAWRDYLYWTGELDVDEGEGTV